jgi:hypothetical protein
MLCKVPDFQIPSTPFNVTLVQNCQNHCSTLPRPVTSLQKHVVQGLPPPWESAIVLYTQVVAAISDQQSIDHSIRVSMISGGCVALPDIIQIFILHRCHVKEDLFQITYSLTLQQAFKCLLHAVSCPPVFQVAQCSALEDAEMKP